MINEAEITQNLVAQGLAPIGTTIRSRMSSAEQMAERLKVVKSTAPFLDAAAVQSFAAQPIPASQLREQVAGVAGKYQGRQMAALLAQRDEQEQRKTWDEMDAATRKLLQAEGYKPPVNRGFVGDVAHEFGKDLKNPGRIVGGAVSGALKLLTAAGDVVPHQYRAMSDFSDRGEDNSLRTTALRGLSAVAPLAPFLDRDYRESWTETLRGEEYLLDKNREKARELAGGNESAYRYALTTATLGDRFKAIEEISGAAFGTPEYQKTYMELVGLDQDDNFKAMVDELSKGKVSFGRDLARGMGLTETTDKSSLYGVVSGAGDAAMMWFADPTLVGGKVRKGHRAATRGIDFAKHHTQISDRIISFADNGLDDLDSRAAKTMGARRTALRNRDDAAYWAALNSTELNDFERYATVVTDHFETGRKFRLTRIDKNLGGIFGNVDTFAAKQRDWRAAADSLVGKDPALSKGFDRPSDWFRYMSSEHGMLALAEGQLGGYLRQGVEMPVFSRTGQKRTAAMIRMRENISFLAKDTSLVLNGSVDDGTLMLAGEGAKARLVQAGMDVFRPMAQLTESILTQIPSSNVLRLDDPRLATELKKVLAMGYGQADQEFWFDQFYSSTNLAARRGVVQSALRSMYSHMGVDATPEGRRWIEKEVQKTYQAYSATGRDIGYGGVRQALDPDSQLADAILVPGFNEIRQMVGQSKKLSLNYMLFGSVPASMADGFMGVWKPSVVLRLGFIPRAGGEEALAFLFRGGLRPLLENWSTLPVARRDDAELLFPFRSNARFLEWMGDASVLERGHYAEIATHFIEGAARANAFVGSGITPQVRGAARSLYTSSMGQRLGFDLDRLEASTNVYKLRRLQALDRAVADLEGAEAYLGQEFVDIPGVGRSRVDQDAQAMLVRARRRQLNRLQYAHKYARNPIAERIFAEEWGRVSTTGGANVYDRAVDPLKDATLVVTGKNRFGRPARQRYGMKTIGGQFSNVSTNDLKSYFNAVKSMESSRAYEQASKIAALYVDPEIVAHVGRVNGNDAAFQAMSDAWDELGERSMVRFAVRDYLKSGDPVHLTRALDGKYIHELPDESRMWLQELFRNPNKYGRNAIEAIVADVPQWAKSLDKTSFAALRAGDLDLLDAVGKRELRARLLKPDMTAQLQKMDRMNVLPDGRTVEQPPARGHARVYTPMVDHATAQRLVRGELEIDDPVARGAYQRIKDRIDEEQVALLIEQGNRMGRPPLVPLSGWATQDPQVAEAVAAAMSGMADSVTVGRVDVPLERFSERSENVQFGETVLHDHDLLQLTVAEQTASWEEAIDDLADKLWGEYKDMTFSKSTGKPMPAIVRPLADKDFDMGHLMNANHEDLPLEVLAPERVPYHHGIISQILTKGMDEIISPAIDAIAREPMFVEQTMKRMRNARWVEGFYMTPQIERLKEQVSSTAARKTGINVDDDVFVKAQEIQFDIEYMPIDGSAMGFASGNKFYLDQEKLKANYEAGLALERKAWERIKSKGEPPRSAGGALAWADVEPDQLYAWFERNGGYPAYERFVYDHERAHLALGHTHADDLEPSAYPTIVQVASKAEIEPMVRAKSEAAIVEVGTDPIQLKKARTDAARRRQGLLPGTAPNEGAAVTYTGRKLPDNVRSSLRADDPALAAIRTNGLDWTDANHIQITRSPRLRGTPLQQETIAEIRDAARAGKRFVVDDTDASVVRLLDGIGADYELIHAGAKPRINVARPVQGPPPMPNRNKGLPVAQRNSAVATDNTLQGHPYFNMPEGATEIQIEKARLSLERKIRSRARNAGLDPDELLKPSGGEYTDWLMGDEAADARALLARNGIDPSEIHIRREEVEALVGKAQAQLERQASMMGLTEDLVGKQMQMDSLVLAANEEIGDPLLDAARQIDEAMSAKGYTDEELEGVSDRGRKEIEANDIAFRLNNMPFGDYVSKADEALLQLRMAWDSVPAHLKAEDISVAQLRNSADVPQLIKDLNKREINGVRQLFSHQDKVDTHISQIAFGGAANDMAPYIDASNVRSQFQQHVRHFMPFQFAEEQFLKRWARTFTYSPESIRKAQLYWHGLQESGVVEENEFGEPIFVFPGTGAMKVAFAEVSSLFGGDMVIPEASNLTGNVKYALPGMDSMGLPSTGPLVGLPMKYLANQFPELKKPIEDFQRSTSGERAVGRSYVDQLVPTSIMRFHHALLADPERDKRFMVAQNATIRWMAAEDPEYFERTGKHLFPGEDATAEELEEFKYRVKRWTRNNFLLQAVLGFVAPTTPTFDVPDLAPEFKKMLAASGDYETAAGEFLAKYPDATPYTIFNTKSTSGYSFDTTKSTAPFILENKDILGAYKYAGAYLVPDAPAGDEFDRQAYTESLELDMRKLGAPDEVVGEIYYREGAREFYKQTDLFEEALVAVGNDAKAKARMNAAFSKWKKEYLAQHPVFKRELFSGKARDRRMSILDEMRQVVVDERAAASPNTPLLAELVQNYDQYLEAMELLNEDRTDRGKARRKRVKAAFDQWSRTYVKDNPAVEHFYLRVVRPEIRGLADIEEAAA